MKRPSKIKSTTFTNYRIEDGNRSGIGSRHLDPDSFGNTVKSPKDLKSRRYVSKFTSSQTPLNLSNIQNQKETQDEYLVSRPVGGGIEEIVETRRDVDLLD